MMTLDAAVNPTGLRPAATESRVIERLRAGRWTRDEDLLASEEPMEIRLLWDEEGMPARKSISVTMRTPGNDFELAAGFLAGESIIASRDDVVDIAYCTDEAEEQAYNIVTVTLRPGPKPDLDRLERNFFTTSSCGVCGKASLEALEVSGCHMVGPGFQIAVDVVQRLPGRLREAQRVFDSTGGLHAAGLFTRDGELVSLREDVGRHNAVDKLIGERILAGAMPLSDYALMLSGRASFELLQKALVARIPVVCAVGAPSSLAVKLADAFGVTLAGFVRADGFNVYAGRERITD